MALCCKVGSGVAPKVSQFFEVIQGQRKLWRTTRKKKDKNAAFTVFNIFFLLLPTDLLSSNSIYIQIFLAMEIDRVDDQVAMELENGVSTLDWDLHGFGVFNTDMSFVLESGSFLSLDSLPSTGYLEDAIVEWNNRCKRKRAQSYTYPLNQTGSDDHRDNILFQNLWNLNYQEDQFVSGSIPASTDDSANSSLSSGPSSSTETKQRKATPTTHKRQATEDTRVNRSSTPSRKIAYPFEVVKPGGEEGDVTLEEINERILKRPSRPVRHPIGEFACLPSVHAAEGPGLSGKAVVALTRIQTQGRGTITIIRTKG